MKTTDDEYRVLSEEFRLLEQAPAFRSAKTGNCSRKTKRRDTKCHGEPWTNRPTTDPHSADTVSDLIITT